MSEERDKREPARREGDKRWPFDPLEPEATPGAEQPRGNTPPGSRRADFPPTKQE